MTKCEVMVSTGEKNPPKNSDMMNPWVEPEKKVTHDSENTSHYSYTTVLPQFYTVLCMLSNFSKE